MGWDGYAATNAATNANAKAATDSDANANANANADTHAYAYAHGLPSRRLDLGRAECAVLQGVRREWPRSAGQWLEPAHRRLFRQLAHGRRWQPDLPGE